MSARADGRPCPPAAVLHGVRVHNLRGIDVDIPLGRFTVITGVSGAGKSSLLRGTLAVEARRRFLETLSAADRSGLAAESRPAADRLEGIPAAVLVPPTPMRPTLGGAAGIDAELRELFVRWGEIHCDVCRRKVRPASAKDLAAAAASLPTGTRFQLAFPVAPPGSAPPDAAVLRAAGWTRLVAGGRTVALDAWSGNALPQDALVVVDRLQAPTSESRMLDAVEQAWRNGGTCVLLVPGGDAAALPAPFCDRMEIDGQPWRRADFRRDTRCAGCGREFLPAEPRLLSPYSQRGRCPRCRGAGRLEPGKNGAEAVCPECQGTQLRLEARAIRLGGLRIDELLGACADELPSRLAQRLGNSAVALRGDAARDPALRQIVEIVERLQRLRLGSRTLSQRTHDLSSGERTRVALAGLLARRLSGVLVLCDEPSSGLDALETGALLDAIREFITQGNTVVVADHDRRIVEASDWVIDLGPGGGNDGGTVLYEGPPQGLPAVVGSPTADVLSGRWRTEVRRRRVPAGRLVLTLHERGAAAAGAEPARERTLPTGVLTVWPTGCGAERRAWLKGIGAAFDAAAAASGGAALHRSGGAAVVRGEGEQLPTRCRVLGGERRAARSPRGNPLSALNALGALRQLFAETPLAVQRHLRAASFSFHSPRGGRCPACEGTGLMRIALEFLADLEFTCPECRGARLTREMLDITYRGLSLPETLRLTAGEAVAHFAKLPKLQRAAMVLQEAGLGALPLGRPLSTLSDGEAARLELAEALLERPRGPTLFVLIEPTSGLHPVELPALRACWDTLLDCGHTLLVIDPREELRSAADMLWAD